MADKADFEPKIVGFLCNWCSYTGADLAGTSRLQYPPNIRIIKVMCSGRITPGAIVKAFEHGADGVIGVGCPPDQCQYVKGNETAEKTFDKAKEILHTLGIEPSRVSFERLSRAEPEKLQEVMGSFASRIQNL